MKTCYKCSELEEHEKLLCEHDVISPQIEMLKELYSRDPDLMKSITLRLKPVHKSIDKTDKKKI